MLIVIVIYLQSWSYAGKCGDGLGGLGRDAAWADGPDGDVVKEQVQQLIKAKG
jgi:hypothetical protein